MNDAPRPARNPLAALRAARGAVARVPWMTTLGWTLLVLGAGATAVAWRFAWDELWVLGVGMLVVVVLSLLFSLGRPRLDVKLVLRPQRVVVGERAAGAIEVRNAATRRLAPLRIELPVGAGVAQFDLPSLAPDADHEQTFVVPTTRRSVVPIGPITSVRGDPLGVIRREVAWGESTELYVHPQTVELHGVASGWLRDLEGQSTNDLSPSDLAFHTLREYVPGDDRRHIHWRTSARIGTLMVRQFVDTRRSQLCVVLSTEEDEYADPDEFELAVSIAASLGRRLLLDDHEVTCVSGTTMLPAHSVDRFLDSMAGVELRSGTSDGLQRAAAFAARRASAASVALLVAGSGTTLAMLRAAADRLPPHIRVFSARARLGEPVAVQRSERLTVLDIGDLDELPTALFSVTHG